MGVKTFFRRFLRRHRRISHRSGLGLDAVRAAREVNRPTPEELFDAECACEFLIVRILGNDLYPRHYERQTINNLGFLLKNESDFPSTRKLFVVNRIFCRDTEAAVLEKLASAGAACVRIPFDHEAYREARMSDESRISEAELERRDNSASRQELLQANILGHAERIRYTMNVNAARNLALREGKGAARWTLPLDGNSILADEAFARLCEEVRSAPLARHVILPFKRLERNDAFLQTRAVGQSREEPQIVFHCRSQLEFDERFPYGLRDKVELLLRLGVPGPWHNLPPVRSLPLTFSEASLGDFKLSEAIVMRLASGRPGLDHESAQRKRYDSRNQAIFETLRHLDKLTDVPARVGWADHRSA